MCRRKLAMTSKHRGVHHTNLHARAHTTLGCCCRLVALYEATSNKPFPANKSYMALDITCVNEDGDDVDVPWVKYDLAQ
jgi:hypothetical protein